MNIFSGLDHYFKGGAVITVGSFDGVHSGHRKLISLLNNEAQNSGREAVIITFEPHPRQVLRGDNRLLSTIDEKLFLLEEAGVKNVVVIEFTKEFAGISGDAFAREILKEKLGGEVIYVGEGHSFGRDKGGSIDVLEGCGFEVKHIERFDLISSTMVREAINSGEVKRAHELLGAPYLAKTPLVETTKLLPPKGSYLCEKDGKELILSCDEIIALKTEHTIRFLSNQL